MIGRTIGHYRVIDKLGEGGMGSVYKAVDVMVDRPVALKVLHQYTSREAAVIERFRSEASLLAKLHDPNIATLFTFFQEDGEFFMVMEFVPGITLSSLVRDRGPINPREAVDLMMQVLSGLEHAHQLGVFHRDIKPANILVTESGRVKITDFGIARAFGTERLTRDARLVGTVEYLPPERIRGLEGDARSDVYAVGVLLYELLTKRVPFERDTEFELMRAHLEQLPPPLHVSSANIPEALDRIVLRALEKQPEDRFATAWEMRSALSSFLAGSAVMVRSASRSTGKRPILKSRFVWIATASIALLLFAALLATQHSRRPTATASKPPISSSVAGPVQALRAPTTGPVLSNAIPNPFTANSVEDRHESARTAARKEGIINRPATAKPAKPNGVQVARTLHEVHKLYISKMPNGLDSYLRASISRKLADSLTVVLSRSDADAVLESSDSRAPDVVRMVDITGKHLLWSGSADDKRKLYLNLKRGGPREVAEKLTAQLKKALD